MKIQPAAIENFLKNPNPAVTAVLVYGPDTGLISLRAELLARTIVPDTNDPFRVVELSSDQLREDSARLFDEMSAMSFGGGRRLIKIKDAENNLTPLFKDVFKNPPSGSAFVVVTASELAPTSALRKLFEANANLAALPCYHDDAINLRTVIVGEMKKRNITPSEPEVIPFITANCQGDRMVAISEIEKLFLYMGPENKVSFGDVTNLIGETTESSFEDICQAAAGGNFSLANKHLDRALRQGIMPVVILLTLQNYFSRIHSVIGMISSGQAMEQAISNLSPPVFFKQLPVFRQHVSRFLSMGENQIWNIMDLLYKAELECKKTGSNAELVINRTLMRIAFAKAQSSESRV